VPHAWRLRTGAMQNATTKSTRVASNMCKGDKESFGIWGLGMCKCDKETWIKV